MVDFCCEQKTHYQSVTANFERIQEELADVLIYALLLSNELNINPEQAITDKMKKNGESILLRKHMDLIKNTMNSRYK